MGQPPLGVALGGPGIAEVDIEPVHFPGAKKSRGGPPRRRPRKTRSAPQVPGPLHGHHHGVGHPLHRHKEDLWLRRCGLAGEAALAAAQLHPEGLGTRRQGPPMPPEGLGLPNQPVGAGLHPGIKFFFLLMRMGCASFSGSAGPRGRPKSLSGYHTITFPLCQRLSSDFPPLGRRFPLSNGPKRGMIKVPNPWTGRQKVPRPPAERRAPWASTKATGTA